MRILLLHLDGKLPNLALMRVAAHHRQLGDEVELRRAGNAAALEPRFGDAPWDRVYNARMLNDETAAAIASVNYRDDSMQRPRIYTAWG